MKIHKLKEQARRHEQREEWERALQLYVQLLQSSDVAEIDFPLYNRAGDLHLRLGRPARAVDFYLQAADRYSEIGLYNNAIALCNKALRYFPERPDIYRRLAECSGAQGFTVEARRWVADYAERLLQTQGVDEATRALSEVADRLDDPDVRALLGRRLAGRGKARAAVKQLRQAYAGWVAAGRITDARKLREEILGLDPEAELEPLPESDGAGDTVLDAAEQAAPGEPDDAGAVSAAEDGSESAEPAHADLESDLGDTEEPAGDMAPGYMATDYAAAESVGPAEPAAEDEVAFTEDESVIGEPDELPPPEEHDTEADADDLPYLEPPVPDGDEERAGLEQPDDDSPLEQPDDDSPADDLEFIVSPDEVAGTDDVYEEDAVAEKAYAEDLLADETFAEGAVADEAFAEEGVADEIIAEEGVADEIIAEEGVADEALGEEAVAGDAAAAEAPADEPPREEAAAAAADMAAKPADADAEDAAADAGAVAPVKDGPDEPPRDPEPARAAEAAPGADEDGIDPYLGIKLHSLDSLEFPDLGEIEIDESLAGLEVMAGPEAAPELRAGESEDPASDAVGAGGAGSGKPPGELDPAESGQLLEFGEEDLVWDPVAATASLTDVQDILDRTAQLVAAGNVAGAARVLERLAERLMSRERYEEAVRVVERLTALRRDDIPLHHRLVELAARTAELPLLLQAYLGLAGALTRAGETEKAQVVYDRVLGLDPGNAEAADALSGTAGSRSAGNSGPGAAADDEAELDALIAEFKRRVDRQLDDDWTSRYDLGIAFREMGLLDEAIAEFQAALRGGKQQAKIYEQLGQCFMGKGQHSVAAKVLARGAAIASVEGDVTLGLNYHLGRCYEELGQRAEAKEAFARVVKDNPRFADAEQRFARL